MQLPEKDVLMETKKQLMAKLDVFMAGRVAEELMFGSENITTGMPAAMKECSICSLDILVEKYLDSLSLSLPLSLSIPLHPPPSLPLSRGCKWP